MLSAYESWWMELALAGRKDEATAAIALRSRFASVSSELTATVLAWQEAATQDQP